MEQEFGFFTKCFAKCACPSRNKFWLNCMIKTDMTYYKPFLNCLLIEALFSTPASKVDRNNPEYSKNTTEIYHKKITLTKFNSNSFILKFTTQEMIFSSLLSISFFFRRWCSCGSIISVCISQLVRYACVGGDVVDFYER